MTDKTPAEKIQDKSLFRSTFDGKDEISTRFYSSCMQALKEQAQFEAMSKDEREKFEQELNGLPIDDDELRLFIKKFLGKTRFVKIMQRTEAIIKKKNEEEDDKKNKRIEEPRSVAIPGLLLIDHYQENAEFLWVKYPYFYDKVGIWWMWKTNHWVMVDEVDMSNLLDDSLGFRGQTISSSIKNNYLEAMKRIGRKRHPKDAPEKWIQFKDKAFSLSSKEVYQVQPNYFFCNPIPWEIGEVSDTPVMDKLFVEWVGEKYKLTLYEIIAYCCYTKYPIQAFFCLYGIGRNGKSCYLRLLTKFVGIENICSTDLDLICGSNRSRFETSKMFKKLVSQMGETNFGTLQSSNVLKQLTGGDLMNFELKGKNGFTGYNYAKIIIASNSLPCSQDTSDGFYRRWIIIDFPNNFPEGKDIVDTIPDQEYRNLAKKVTDILPVLLERGSLTNQGDIIERRHRYVMASNPLSIFIKRYCIIDSNLFCRYSTMYTAYAKYLVFKKRRVISVFEFSKLLATEGYEIRRISRNYGNEYINDRWIEGVELDPSRFESMSVVEAETIEGNVFSDSSDYSSISPYRRKNRVEIDVKESLPTLKLEEKEEMVEDNIPSVSDKVYVYLKCYICGFSPCIDYDNSHDGKGRPICNDCKIYITQ